MSSIAMARPRYIAFKLTGTPISRRALGNALRGRARHEGWTEVDQPQLTRFLWPHGIVRVEHTHSAKARTLLEAITWASEGDRKSELRIETIATSGTLKALTGRLGILTERDASARPA